MSWSNFARIYKPLKDQPIEGYEVPRTTSPYNVWTLVDAEGNPVLLPGWHLVNRLGYYITEKPWTEDTDLWVKW